MKDRNEMHGQTLRMSLALGRNVRAVFRRPLHVRDAGQRFAHRRNDADPTTQVCERERRPPANQADGAARTSGFGTDVSLGCPAAHPQRWAAKLGGAAGVKDQDADNQMKG